MTTFQKICVAGFLLGLWIKWQSEGLAVLLRGIFGR